MPGVAEVASVGGAVRQYQIDVDPNRLRAFRIPLSAVVEAVMRSNRNVGGNVVEASGTWSVVRGLGLIERVSDIEQIVIGAENGAPIFLRQVADGEDRRRLPGGCARRRARKKRWAASWSRATG